MTLLYDDPLFLEHETGDHPECPARLTAIRERLAAKSLSEHCQQPTWKSASPAQVARVHDPEYIEAVRAFAERGGGRLERDTVVSRRSYDVAIRASGAVCDAVDRVASGEDATALCLVRPPGHHALERDAMGFCLFNHIAVGAKHAIGERGLDRVLIVDWDVHHGNGTQDTFWDDGQVGFFSIHRYPFYPGTGSAEEIGTGPGLGMTKNVPIEFGISREDYLRQFTSALESFADKVRPQLVLISAGFDAHRADPIGSLGLESEDFATLSQIVLTIAKSHAGGRVVSVLEGGYDLAALGESVSQHLAELLAFKLPSP